MNKIELPNYFTRNHRVPEVYVHSFSSDAYSDKSKVQLNANLISFLTEGSKELYYENDSQIVTNKDFVIAKSGNCLMSENLSEDKKYTSLLFFFSNNFVTHFKEKYQIENRVKQNNSEMESKFKIISYDTFISNFVYSLQQLIQSEITLTEDFLILKLEEILLYLVQKNGEETITFLDHHTLQKHHVRLKNIVEKNIFSKLTLEELAFLSHMSLSTFKREFYKIYTTSPSKWIQEKRLEKSAQMLLNDRERPIDVYASIGYESLSSFTQSFKHKYGITPKQYQLKKMNQ
ncbi:AraC family transcriptional regulator [Flavobacterium sp. J27]|uniref:helix-turn-helix domain-containing protein n=1 Tax=Flavobacterium sp. J27 TaxID=2060419 RepID=UPI0010314ACE|nr:AraC family transcriptional regulator [Flavobacterium sp. J27]